jgi:peptide/nickel transport system ATP-binding protein
MYTGRIIEEGSVGEILTRPLHPYTQGLIASIPSGRVGTRLRAIEGNVPSLSALPPGCTFAPRCPQRMGVCTTAVPALVEITPAHRVRCYLHADAKEPRVGPVALASQATH